MRLLTCLLCVALLLLAAASTDSIDDRSVGRADSAAEQGKESSSLCVQADTNTSCSTAASADEQLEDTCLAASSGKATSELRVVHGWHRDHSSSSDALAHTILQASISPRCAGRCEWQVDSSSSPASSRALRLVAGANVVSVSHEESPAVVFISCRQQQDSPTCHALPSRVLVSFAGSSDDGADFLPGSSSKVKVVEILVVESSAGSDTSQQATVVADQDSRNDTGSEGGAHSEKCRQPREVSWEGRTALVCWVAAVWWLRHFALRRSSGPKPFLS